MNNKYYIQKDSLTNDIVYIEFDKIDGYKVNPKTKKEDEIEVSKIIFVSNSLSEKVIKKKIEYKINSLLKFLEEIDDTTDEGAIRQSLMDAQRLKLMIINIYAKYLGNTYQGLTLKKMQVIISELRVKLYVLKETNNLINYRNLQQQNKEVERPKKGRGR